MDCTKEEQLERSAGGGKELCCRHMQYHHAAGHSPKFIHLYPNPISGSVETRWPFEEQTEIQQAQAQTIVLGEGCCGGNLLELATFRRARAKWYALRDASATSLREETPRAKTPAAARKIPTLSPPCRCAPVRGTPHDTPFPLPF